MKRKLLFAVLMIAGALGLSVSAQTWTADNVAAGEALLYNVGTGQYLTRGNGWNTQASIGDGMRIQLVKKGNDYVIRTGVNGTNYGLENMSGATVYTDQSRSKNSTWTFTQVATDNGPVYTIVSAANHGGGAGAYLTAEGGASTIVGPGNDGSSNNARWKVYLFSSQAQRFNTLAPDATTANPVDATILIGNPQFNTMSAPKQTQSWTMTASNQNLSGGTYLNPCAESWRSTFTLSQALTGIPNGYYQLRAQAALTDYAGSGANWPVVYATASSEVTSTFKEMSEGEGSMAKMSEQFTAGKYFTDWTTIVTVTDGNLTIGVKGTRTDTWCIWDNFQLRYLGPLDLSGLQADLDAAKARADATEGTIPTALYNNIATVVTNNYRAWDAANHYTTEAQYTTAINNINNAITTYAPADVVAAYGRYMAIRNAAKAIIPSLDTNATDSQVNGVTNVANVAGVVNTAIANLRASFIQALPSATVPADPGYIDVTAVMVDNAGVHTNTDYWTIEGTPNGGWSWGLCNYGECEFYQQNFKFYQTLALGVGTWEFGVTGFHRAGNHNTHFYAGEDEILIPGVANTVVNSMAEAKNYFDQGNGKVALNFIIESSQNVEIGIKNEDTETDKWTIFRDFTLKYYGPVDYSIYATRWNELVAQANEAKSTYNLVTMTPEYTALNAAIADAPDGSSKANYLAKIGALESAIAAFNATAPAWQTAAARYQQIRTAVLAINNGIDVSTADAQVSAAQSVSDIETAVGTVRQALANYLATAPAANMPIDVTAALIDNASPGVAGNDDYWIASGTVGQGNNLREYWSQSGTTYTQQLSANMPQGNYVLTVVGYTRTGFNAVIKANEFTAPMAQVASNVVNGLAGGDTWIAAGNGVNTLLFQLTSAQALTIGLTAASNTADYWTVWRSFKLEYLGNEFPAYTLVTGKMNADVAAAQASAEATFLADKTIANYNALVAAISAAEISKAAYDVAAAELAKARAIRENHNFATAEAATTFDGVISTWTTAYDNGTMSNAEANSLGTTLGTVVTGHRDGANGAAVKYIESGFGLNDFDAALYINTWSVEGETDGTNFKVPFFEYWIGDDQTLAAHDWVGTLSGLESGLYRVSASVRVRSTNGVAATEATGITLAVNGTAVDVTEGSQVGESQFNLGSYQAEALVKDGVLNVKFSVAEGNNISWLSFQNVKYTKVRDLTPEEAAIVPTAIALDQTSVTLTAAANTVTLTPSFTPLDATPTVTWTTSDAAVATVVDGVVTGVAPGTATITVTSVFDASVSATCEVTVNYPESSFATTTYINDGATRTIYTLSSNNLIKNGAFEYPDAFFAWTSANNFSDKLTAAKFTTQTEGGNTYLVGTVNEGSNASGSIGMAWPIEAGKTYAFSYRVKSLGTAAGEQGYLVTSLTNTKGTETSVLGKPTLTAGEWTTFTKVFTNTDNYQYLQVKFRWLANNFGFDDFYLVEVVDEDIVGNVDYVTENTPTVNIGTGAFQYNQSNIDAASALVQDVATVAEVEAAYTSVRTINAPAAGTAYNVVLQFVGDMGSGNNKKHFDNYAITYLANDRDDAGGYNIQYYAAPAPYLAQAFTMTRVNGNQYKMSQRDVDGNERYICLGTVYSGNNNQIRTTTDAANAAVFEIIPDATRDGIFHIWNVAASQYIGAQDAGMYTVNSHIDFSIAQTQKVSVPVTVNADYDFSTLILPFDAPYPEGWPTSGSEGAGAYKVVDINGGSIVLEREADKFHANVPYIIYAPEGLSETLENWGAALRDTYTTDYLNGSYVARTAPAGAYVLSAKTYTTGKKVGFYRLQSDTQVPAHRAYFTIPAASPVKAEEAFFFSGFGDETAIGNVGLGDQKVEGIYNVNGVKTDRLLRGTNIIRMADGSVRKVIVK